MFGYVKAYKPELKICEYEYYRAAYCGLCRANGKCTGCASRLLLNYDFVFIALVRLSLTGEKPEFKARRCLAHPAKKRVEMLGCETLDFCAYSAAILNYHKCLDDISDEKGKKRLRARFSLPALRRMRKKALKVLPGLDEIISGALSDLAELEAQKCASVDRPAEVFGRMTSEILAYGLDGSAAATARQIGLHIGKWIYIADALDDYEADAKSGSYNPFVLMWENGISESDADGISAALTRELMDAELGFDLIDYDDKRLGGVIRNIIYCGMPRRAREIRQKGDKKDE